MAITYSSMLALGTKLPAFELINTIDGKKFNSSHLTKNKAKVIMFICNHCPFVLHCLDQIISISEKYSPAVEFVAISSNDVSAYPEDAPEKMKKLASERNFNFPYLYDESQEIAKKYMAACTPEFYLFDENDLLIYRGRIDDSSPGNGKESTGKDLREAIDDFLAKKPLAKEQFPSMGCNIKWK